MFHEARQYPATKYLLNWLDEVVLTEERLDHAEKILRGLTAKVAVVGKFFTTPQTPPHHAEGPYLSDHIKRILATISAIDMGASLAQVEEFAREKDWLLEFQKIEETIRANSAFLSAYAVLHDIAKPKVITFSSTTVGEVSPVGTIEVFDKRFRAFAAAHGALTGKILVTQFFKQFGIRAHYEGHERLAASDSYAEARQQVLTFFNLPLSHAKLLNELVRCHLDVIHSFQKGADQAQYRVLERLPDKQGLNANLFLELVPSALFLDDIAGSLVYTTDQKFASQITSLTNFFKAERSVQPLHHEERLRQALRGRKQAVKYILSEAKLDPETVFALLVTPIGPIRGQVMEQIYELITHPDGDYDFGPHTNDLKKRATLAKRLLIERGLEL